MGFGLAVAIFRGVVNLLNIDGRVSVARDIFLQRFNGPIEDEMENDRYDSKGYHEAERRCRLCITSSSDRKKANKTQLGKIDSCCELADSFRKRTSLGVD